MVRELRDCGAWAGQGHWGGFLKKMTAKLDKESARRTSPGGKKQVDKSLAAGDMQGTTVPWGWDSGLEVRRGEGAVGAETGPAEHVRFPWGLSGTVTENQWVGRDKRSREAQEKMGLQEQAWLMKGCQRSWCRADLYLYSHIHEKVRPLTHGHLLPPG